MNFCRSCGKSVVADIRFCSGCGAPLAAPENVRSQIATGAAGVVHAATPPEPTHTAPPPTLPLTPGGVTGLGFKAPSRRVLTAVSAVLLVAVLVGGLVGLEILRGDAPDRPATTTTTASAATGTDTRGPASLARSTKLTLVPVATKNERITGETIAEAIRVMRERLDSSGVSGAKIARQGASNIVVILPGDPDRATIALLQRQGQLRLRPVLVGGGPGRTALPAPTVTAVRGATPAAEASAGTPKDASDLAWVTPDVEAAYAALDCANPKDVEAIVDDPAKPMVTCDVDRQAKYILGPAEVFRSQVSNATAAQQQSQGGSIGLWEVRLEFNAEGSNAFDDVTSRLVTLPTPRNQFAIVLDKRVISAPVVQAVISDGRTQISGSFTRDTAAAMARQLNVDAVLPFEFLLQSRE